jgi:hypothetical protein
LCFSVLLSFSEQSDVPDTADAASPPAHIVHIAAIASNEIFSIERVKPAIFLIPLSNAFIVIFHGYPHSLLN